MTTAFFVLAWGDDCDATQRAWAKGELEVWRLVPVSLGLTLCLSLSLSCQAHARLLGTCSCPCPCPPPRARPSQSTIHGRRLTYSTVRSIRTILTFASTQLSISTRRPLSTHPDAHVHKYTHGFVASSLVGGYDDNHDPNHAHPTSPSSPSHLHACEQRRPTRPR